MTDWNDLAAAKGYDWVKEQLRAVEEADGAPPPAPDFPTISAGWRTEVQEASHGGRRSTMRAVQLVLEHDPRWRNALAYDEFSERLMIRAPIPWASVGREWADHDTHRLQIWFGEHYGWEPSESQMSGGLSTVSRDRAFHPVREYLAELPSVDSDLLSIWMREGVGGKDPADYLTLVGRKYLIGAVARVMEPGCKHDCVAILEGEQGRNKSTALLELFAPWSSDAPIIFGDKDTYLQLHGTWLLELAELDGWNKAETSASKAFFSQRHDRYRPPYAHRMVDVPRQTVFAGTTNQREYLKDLTGNRRYWPVRCGIVDLAWLKEHKCALWREALDAYRAGERWWVEGDEERKLVEQVQESRMSDDPWEAMIDAYLVSSGKTRWTTEELLTEALGLARAQVQRAHQTRLGYISNALGLRKARWQSGKIRCRGYQR